MDHLSPSSATAPVLFVRRTTKQSSGSTTPFWDIQPMMEEVHEEEDNHDHINSNIHINSRKSEINLFLPSSASPLSLSPSSVGGGGGWDTIKNINRFLDRAQAYSLSRRSLVSCSPSSSPSTTTPASSSLPTPAHVHAPTSTASISTTTTTTTTTTSAMMVKRS